MKKRQSPTDRQTFNQLYRRWMFSFCQQNWTALEIVDKKTWSDLASFFDFSLINGYLRENLMRWDRFESPSAYLPITQLGAVGTVHTWTAIQVQRSIQYQLKLASVNQNWGIILYMTKDAPNSWAREDVFGVDLQNSTALIKRSYFPTEPGTYRLTISLFTHNGEKYDYPIGKKVIFS